MSVVLRRAAPLFSIVIPAYNRELEIRRAIASCLGQDHADFEIVAVDDGSADGTCAAVESLHDSRIRLFRHPRNLGEAAARNLGSSQASGDWLIYLDSDDELLPGALSHMRGLVEQSSPDIGRYAFRYRRDDGRTSPFPPPPEAVLDYTSFVTWLNGVELWDFLSCTRRQTFETVQWPAGRWSDQALYHLDFARRFHTSFHADHLGMVHLDADNRTQLQRRTPKNSIEMAEALMRQITELLERHGPALERYAPAKYQLFKRSRISYAFLLGKRSEALAEGIGCLRATPFLPELWTMLAFGLLGPEVFAKARARRSVAGRAAPGKAQAREE